MTIQTDIFNTVLQGKGMCGCWAEVIVNKEKYGEDISCCETKLMLLVEWISILQAYYSDNYTLETIKTPTINAITSAEALMTLAKIKELIRNGL